MKTDHLTEGRWQAFLKETFEITNKAAKITLERSEGVHEKATGMKETGKGGAQTLGVLMKLRVFQLQKNRNSKVNELVFPDFIEERNWKRGDPCRNSV